MRGRVASESEPGGGILNCNATPPPALTRRTLPFQGRDKSPHSILMPADLITFAHFSLSLFM